MGAISSTYQKERVEHVCRRLGLTPLCYLWERDQIDLLDSMIQDGVEAIIIKVAAAGLTSKHLGMTLKEVRDHLIEMGKKFGSHGLYCFITPNLKNLPFQFVAKAVNMKLL